MKKFLTTKNIATVVAFAGATAGTLFLLNRPQPVISEADVANAAEKVAEVLDKTADKVRKAA